ncbi:MAG: hypothetical protein IT495_21305 [Gammaproteobacteria bacterium]|nr:hypothetical protein [Gammaproteobacteria bacterium]
MPDRPRLSACPTPTTTFIEYRFDCRPLLHNRCFEFKVACHANMRSLDHIERKVDFGRRPYHPAADPNDPAYRSAVDHYVAGVQAMSRTTDAPVHPYYPLSDPSDPVYQKALADYVARMREIDRREPCTGAIAPLPVDDAPSP